MMWNIGIFFNVLRVALIMYKSTFLSSVPFCSQYILSCNYESDDTILCSPDGMYHLLNLKTIFMYFSLLQDFCYYANTFLLVMILFYPKNEKLFMVCLSFAEV
jgi:hypothetical protein